MQVQRTCCQCGIVSIDEAEVDHRHNSQESLQPGHGSAWRLTIAAQCKVCQQEGQEPPQVVQTDAVVNPAAVMVKACDAPVIAHNGIREQPLQQPDTASALPVATCHCLVVLVDKYSTSEYKHDAVTLHPGL